MSQCLLSFNIIIALLFSFAKSQTTSPSFPLNGTFIITTYKENICSNTIKIEGYVPTDYWNVMTTFGKIFKPVSFNPNISRLTYQECDGNPLDCVGENFMSCLNECTQMKGIDNTEVFYSCNFMPKSNLSLFTFTGFGDSGCNNNNGNVYPQPLTKACWTLEGNHSMSITTFIERRMTVNTYSSKDCTGTITEYNKGFECDQSCIDNPLNANPVFYQCKYSSSSFVQIALSLLMLYLVPII